MIAATAMPTNRRYSIIMAGMAGADQKRRAAPKAAFPPSVGASARTDRPGAVAGRLQSAAPSLGARLRRFPRSRSCKPWGFASVRKTVTRPSACRVVSCQIPASRSDFRTINWWRGSPVFFFQTLPLIGRLHVLGAVHVLRLVVAHCGAGGEGSARPPRHDYGVGLIQCRAYAVDNILFFLNP
jgi:hypothetical protein